MLVSCWTEAAWEVCARETRTRKRVAVEYMVLVSSDEGLGYADGDTRTIYRTQGDFQLELDYIPPRPKVACGSMKGGPDWTYDALHCGLPLKQPSKLDSST